VTIFLSNEDESGVQLGPLFVNQLLCLKEEFAELSMDYVLGCKSQNGPTKHGHNVGRKNRARCI